jgi:hypothetical protein
MTTYIKAFASLLLAVFTAVRYARRRAAADEVEITISIRHSSILPR